MKLRDIKSNFIQCKDTLSALCKVVVELQKNVVKKVNKNNTLLSVVRLAKSGPPHPYYYICLLLYK